jgi:hypothetical protein
MQPACSTLNIVIRPPCMQVWCRADVVQAGCGACECGSVWCRLDVVQASMVQGKSGAGECGVGQKWRRMRSRVWYRACAAGYGAGWGAGRCHTVGVVQANVVQPHCAGEVVHTSVVLCGAYQCGARECGAVWYRANVLQASAVQATSVAGKCGVVWCMMSVVQ